MDYDYRILMFMHLLYLNKLIHSSYIVTNILLYVIQYSRSNKDWEDLCSNGENTELQQLNKKSM